MLWSRARRRIISEREHRSCTESYKLEALALLERHEESARRIERELGISPALLLNWRSYYQATNGQKGAVRMAASDPEQPRHVLDSL